MKLALWNVQGAQGTLTLQRWANILQLIHECGVSLAGIQEYNPGFPLPEAATTALQNDYKCYASPVNGPRVAFLFRNHIVLHILEVIYSPRGLAAALRFQLPHGPRRTVLCVYSKFTTRDKTEVDDFIQSMEPYDIIMVDFNDNIWASPPTRPWQKGLDNAEVLDPLLATSHNPEASQYYTRIPGHGRPRRLDAILVRQQIPNIPWTYYNAIRMPISDHSLVLIGLRCAQGGTPP